MASKVIFTVERDGVVYDVEGPIGFSPEEALDTVDAHIKAQAAQDPDPTPASRKRGEARDLSGVENFLLSPLDLFPGGRGLRQAGEMSRRHAEAYAVPQEAGGHAPSPIEALPGGSAVSYVADLPIAAAQGLAATGEMLAEVFGAGDGNTVANFFENWREGLEPLKSQGSREDAEAIANIQKLAEDKGALAQVTAAVRSFGISPLEALAQAAGTSVPFIAAALAAPEAGVAWAGAAGLGALAGAGNIKGVIHDTVLEEALKAPGVTEEQAHALAEKAQAYTGENKDSIAIGAALGALAAGTGVTTDVARTIGYRALERAIGRRIGQEAGMRTAEGMLTEVAKKGLVRHAATRAGAEAIPEFFQGGQERLASNLALGREGYGDGDPWRGVIGQGTFEALAGAGLGGLSGRAEQYSARKQVQAAEDAEANVGVLSEDRGQRIRDLLGDDKLADLVNSTYDLQQAANQPQPVTTPPAPTVGSPAAPVSAAPSTQAPAPIVGANSAGAGRIATLRSMLNDDVALFDLSEASGVSEPEIRERLYAELQQLQSTQPATADVSPPQDIAVTPVPEAPDIAPVSPPAVSSPQNARSLLEQEIADSEAMLTSMMNRHGDLKRMAKQASTAGNKVKPQDILSGMAVQLGRQQLVSNYLSDTPDTRLAAARSISQDFPELATDIAARTGADPAAVQQEIADVALGNIPPAPAASGLAQSVSTPTAGLDSSLLGAPSVAPSPTAPAPAASGLAQNVNTPTAGLDSSLLGAPSVAPSPTAPAQGVSTGVSIPAPQGVDTDVTPTGGNRYAQRQIPGQGAFDLGPTGIPESEAPKTVTTPASRLPSAATERKRATERALQSREQDLFGLGANRPVEDLPFEQVDTAELTAEFEKQRIEDVQRNDEALADLEFRLNAQEGVREGDYIAAYEPRSETPFQLFARTEPERPRVAARTLTGLQEEVEKSMRGEGDFTPLVPFDPGISQRNKIEEGRERDLSPFVPLTQQLVSEIDKAYAGDEITSAQRQHLTSMLEQPTDKRGAKRRGLFEQISQTEKELVAQMDSAGNARTDRERAKKSQQVANTADRLVNLVERMHKPIRAELDLMRELNDEATQLARMGVKTADRAKQKAEPRTVPRMATSTTRFEDRVDPTKDPKVVTDRAFRDRQEPPAAESREAREARIDLDETEVRNPRYARRLDFWPDATAPTAEALKTLVKAITSSWRGSGPIQVVQSVSDLPKKMQEGMQADLAENALGMGIAGADGVTYLIADNMPSLEDGAAILFHEQLGHLGLRKLFRNDLDRVLMSLYKGNTQLQNDVAIWQDKNPGAYKDHADPLARAVEEVLVERSMAGPLELSWLQKLTALVRRFLRKMKWAHKVTDTEVLAILAKSHDMVIKGKVKSDANPEVEYLTTLDNMPERKNKYAAFWKKDPNRTYSAAMQDVREADMSRAEKKLLLTRKGDANGILRSAATLLNNRDSNAVSAVFKISKEGMSPSALKGALKIMPTSGVIGWFGGRMPVLSDINRELMRLSGTRRNIIRETSDKIGRPLMKFSQKFPKGEIALSDAQAMARMASVSPDTFGTMANALASDGWLREIETNILSNSTSAANATRLVADIKKSISEATVATPEAVAPLRAALKRQARDKVDMERQLNQLVERTRVVRGSMRAWAELGKYAGGQKLYKDIRQFHEDMYTTELALLDARISNWADPNEQHKLRAIRAELMNKARGVSTDKYDKLFADLDPDAVPKDYFPFLRRGKYWLRVVGDANRGRPPQFNTYRSVIERNAARAELAKQYGNDPKIIRVGNDIASEQKDFAETDEQMRQVMETMMNAKQGMDRRGKVKLSSIIDDIYQVHLQSSPERSLRRRFLHSNEVAGYSTDATKNFTESSVLYASQISKLAHSDKLRLLLEGAFETLDPHGILPAEERAARETVLLDMQNRMESELQPPPPAVIVDIANRLSYVYFLTGAATAAIQFTAIPIRVYPRLGVDHGFGAATAMATKYVKFWDKLGSRPETFDGVHNFPMPDVARSEFVRNRPELAYAAEALRRMGPWETMQDTIVQTEREEPRGPEGRGRRALRWVTGVMGLPFQMSENVSRQMSALMAFELEYKKQGKNRAQRTREFRQDPQVQQEARQKHMAVADLAAEKAETAIRDDAVAYAASVLTDAVGDYSSYERPPLTKGQWLRAMFLFKMFSLVQTRFIVGSFWKFYNGGVPKAEMDEAIAGGQTGKVAELKRKRTLQRKNAIKEFTAVSLMAGLFAGIPGFAGYTILVNALKLAMDQLDDEEDNLRDAWEADPLAVKDPDLWFRGKFLPELLGIQKAVDGKGDEYTLVDILMDGPLSVLTNTNLGSRTSIDLKDLWFRESYRGSGTADKVWSTLLSNVAGGSMVTQVLSSWDEFENKQWRRGATKALPAFFRGPINAAAYNEEGVVSRQGDQLLTRDEMSNWDLAVTTFGFRPNNLAKIQNYTITRAKHFQKARTERQRLLDRYHELIRNGATDGEMSTYVTEEMGAFNRKYPHPADELVITYDTLRRSFKNEARSRAMSPRGLRLNKKDTMRAIEAAEPYLP